MSFLVSDLINLAFYDLGVITPTETLTTALQTDAFIRLNAMIDRFSVETLVNPNQVAQTFTLSSGTSAYTLGSGGSFATTSSLRAVKVTSWRAFDTNKAVQAGGRVMSLAEFGEQAIQKLGETSLIPGIVGADTSYPLINVRVFPIPSSSSSSLELLYLTPIADFSTVGDSAASLAQGLIELLHWSLAQELYPQYPRPSNRDLIWDSAARAKAALVTQNAMSRPQPQPAAPQGQQ